MEREEETAGVRKVGARGVGAGTRRAARSHSGRIGAARCGSVFTGRTLTWAHARISLLLASPVSSVRRSFLCFATRCLSVYAAKSADLLTPDGGWYIGGTNTDGLPDGTGTLFAANGSEMAHGTWRAGLQYGHGRVRESGEHYDGELDAGRMHGLGCYTGADGAVFEGQFQQGQPAGFGAQWDAQGKLVACGRYVAGKQADRCPIPMRVLPQRKKISDAGSLRGSGLGAMPCNAMPVALAAGLCNTLTVAVCVHVRVWLCFGRQRRGSAVPGRQLLHWPAQQGQSAARRRSQMRCERHRRATGNVDRRECD